MFDGAMYKLLRIPSADALALRSLFIWLAVQRIYLPWQAGHNKYMEDMQRLTESSFDHDDSINDRVEGGQLESGFLGTARLWTKTFGKVCMTKISMFNMIPNDFQSRELLSSSF